MSMFIGEALSGEGNEIAHIDLLIGSKDGPVGAAFANALARQSEGTHESAGRADAEPGRQAGHGADHEGDDQGHEAGRADVRPGSGGRGEGRGRLGCRRGDSAKDAENLVIVCGVFIHPAAAEDKKIYEYNYQATKEAIASAMRGKPTVAGDDRRQGEGGASVPRFLSDASREHARRPAGAASMSKPKILVQLDTDPQASVFDGVVAVDAGVEQLFRHAAVTSSQVRDLTYGAMFTRGIDELRCTAIFIGGSDVSAGEELLAHVPANILRTAARVGHARLERGQHHGRCRRAYGRQALPAVGLNCHGDGRYGPGRARASCDCWRWKGPRSRSGPGIAHEPKLFARLWRCSCRRPTFAGGDWIVGASRGRVEKSSILIAAGAPGVELVSQSLRASAQQLAVAIDLSAVPPVGLAGIEITDQGAERDNMVCYGAIGVGGTKMKIHKAAIRQLFEANDQVLDAEEIYRIAGQLPT